MSSLKKMIVIGATALTLGGGAAMTAHAQPMTVGYVDSLSWRITDAARHGRISWSEAHQLQGEQRFARDLAWRGQNGPMRPWERQRLSATVHHIQARIGVYAWNGDQQYGYGYGYRYRPDYDRDDWR